MNILEWLFATPKAETESGDASEFREAAASNVAMISSSYEFMLENLIDTPSDRFDGWRGRRYHEN